MTKEDLDVKYKAMYDDEAVAYDGRSFGSIKGEFSKRFTGSGANDRLRGLHSNHWRPAFDAGNPYAGATEEKKARR